MLSNSVHLNRIILDYRIYFQSIKPEDWTLKSAPGKWSKKEILGHLIDSAQNNLRRFIVTQYKQNEKIIYNQVEWVKYSNYQGSAIIDLIELWVLLNKQIAMVINNIPAEKLKFSCDTGKEKKELFTLEFLIEDYISHMRHHLSEIVESS
jgi:hypothetical protein